MDDALGMVEIKGLASAITVADVMLKTANVKLIGAERARGHGWTTIKVMGDVAAVNAAVSAGKRKGEECSNFVTSKVIPRPVQDIKDAFCVPQEEPDDDNVRYEDKEEPKPIVKVEPKQAEPKNKESLEAEPQKEMPKTMVEVKKATKPAAEVKPKKVEQKPKDGKQAEPQKEPPKAEVKVADKSKPKETKNKKAKSSNNTDK